MNNLFSPRRAKNLSKNLSLALAFALTTALPAVLAAALAPSAPAAAHEFAAGDLTIIHPWLRMNIPGRPSAGYMVLSNAGAQDERLIGAHSDAFGRLELHTHSMENGVMKMGPVKDIPIPAGGEAALASGGYHMMMFEPAKPLTEAEPVQITLEFEHAGEVEVWMLVTPLGAPAPADGDGMDHMKHGEEMNHEGHMEQGEGDHMNHMGGDN